MRFLLRIVALLGMCICAYQGGAHPLQKLHTLDALYTIEGYEGKLCELTEEMYKKLDTMQLNGVRLSAMNHRDLFHPILFGQPIPKETLDSVAQSYARQTGRSLEKAKQILMQARGDYVRDCINLVMQRTGLPKRQAEAFGGLLQIVHLLGDGDILDNARFGSLPNGETLVKSLNNNLEVLFKGADDALMPKVKHLQLQMMKLCKKYRFPRDERVFSVALRRLLMQRNVGELINSRWGRTLGKSGITFNEELAKKAAHNANVLYRQEGIARQEKVHIALADPKKRKQIVDVGIPDKNINKMTTRRINTAYKEATEELSLQTGIVQRIKGRNGQLITTLTVPVRQIGKGLVSGASAGVLTFVFSQGTTYAMYQAGSMTDAEYITECEKNLGASLVTGASTCVLVALGATPTGWVVIGAGLTVDAIYNLTFDEIQWVNSFNWEKDWVFGELPTEIQRRRALFMPLSEARGVFTFPTDRTSFLDPQGNRAIQSRATIVDYSSSQEVQQRSSFLEPSSIKGVNSQRRGFLP